MTRSRIALFAAVVSTATLLLVLLAIEGGFRLAFHAKGLRSMAEESFIKKNQLFWMDIFQASKMSVTQRDQHLLWNNLPDVQQTFNVFTLHPQDGQQTYFPTARWVTGPHGFLNAQEDFMQDKRSDEFRVLSIGDSSTVGWGITDPEQNYTAMLQAIRLSESGKSLKTINAGVIGYTSVQGRRFLEINGAALAPDALVTYFGNNDGSLHGQKSDVEIFAQLKDPSSTLTTAQTFLDNFYVVRFLRTRSQRQQHERLWQRQGRVVRVPPEVYEAQIRGMIAWAGVVRAKVVMVMPPVNLLWPTRFFQEDFMAAQAMGLTEYPGKGVPLKCLIDDDCQFAVYGGWNVTNVVRVQPPEHPSPVAALNNEGVALLKSGERKKGEALLRDGLKQDPHNSYLSYNLGTALLEDKTAPDEALALLEQAMADDAGMVRMHAPYRDVLKRVAKDTHTPLVEIDTEIRAEMRKTGKSTAFVDSCHPSPVAHRMIANKIAALL